MEPVKIERKLIQFVDHLSDLSDVDSIFHYLDEQLGKVPGVSDTILCISPIRNRNVIYFREKNKVLVKPAQRLWLQNTLIRKDNIEDSQFLADHLRRPVGQIIAFPIKMVQLEKLSQTTVPATLFIENSVTDSEKDLLIKNLINYIQPIQFSLEKAFIQLYLDNSAIEWQSTFDGLRDPICIFDLDKNILRSNHAFKALVNGTEVSDLLLKSNDPKVQSESGRGIILSEAKGLSLHANTLTQRRIHFKDKEFEIYSYPIVVKDKEAPTTFVNYYIDITKKQSLKSKMLQGEKLAIIGQLAGNISHELNNPLTGIKSLADLIARDPNCDRQTKNDLMEISVATDRCQRIIDNLMMFSNDKIRPERKVVNLNEQIKIAITLSKSLLGSVELHQLYTEDDTSVFVIPELLVQVIYNLIQNACQATQKQSSVIKLETRLNKNMVELRVIDNGTGIEASTLANIFKPFFTTKKIGEGTGLGLSMSLGVIKSFNGRIDVNSEVGQGSEFVVTLPKAMDSIS